MFDKKIDKEIAKIRKRIPDEYNQIELLDELTNPEIDFYMSISNRADGKSYNYLNAFIHLARLFDLRFLLVCEHYELQKTYLTKIAEIYETDETLKLEEHDFKKTDDFFMIYDSKVSRTIGLITDLNNASDLKYQSAVLKKYPIIVYDEFLRISSDYGSDEWERLRTIYESIDRNKEIPYIHFPKVFFLGNAVNFESPILSALDLFNALETHEINTMKQYKNILLEMRRNDKANESKNLRAFNSYDSAMTTGEFKANLFNIISPEKRDKIRNNCRYFYIKALGKYIKITYDIKTYETMVTIVYSTFEEDYSYCYDLADKKENVLFLKGSYYNLNFYKKYDKKIIAFENSFSRDFILKSNLINLNIFKCIKEYDLKFLDDDNEQFNEKIIQENYLEQSMKNIANKFLLE